MKDDPFYKNFIILALLLIVFRLGKIVRLLEMLP